MKRLLLVLTVFICSFSYGQVIVQAGTGLATSGLIHPAMEVDAGWVFKPTEEGHIYQSTLGWLFHPALNKTIYSIKGGVNVKKWTFKAGIGVVDGGPANTIILGAESYIPKWERDGHKVYYGIDVVDGYFYLKMGVRFYHKIKN